MDSIIKITTRDGKEIVNARELHSFLGNKDHFSTWIKDRIKQYCFIENEDYTTFSEFPEKVRPSYRPALEYAISISMAKELSMVERNEKGKKARLYFIECEKRLKENIALSPAELLVEQAKLLLNHDQRLSKVESKLDSLLSDKPQKHFELAPKPSFKTGTSMPLNVYEHYFGNQAMTLEEEGALIRLMTYYWLYGPLKNDNQFLSTIAKNAPVKVIESIKSKFEVTSKGLIHSLLYEEKKIREARRKSGSIGGKKTQSKIRGH